LGTPTGITNDSDVYYDVEIVPNVTGGMIPPGILDSQSITRTMSGAELLAFLTGPKTLKNFYDRVNFVSQLRQDVYEALSELSDVEFSLRATFTQQGNRGASGTVDLIKIKVRA
jgi:hypothetical protein